MTRACATTKTLALLLCFWAQTGSAQSKGWLDDDPNAIWSRPPGFYEDGWHWYAILHTRPDVERVRLVGEFTDEESNAIDLTYTSDGKSGSCGSS